MVVVYFIVGRGVMPSVKLALDHVNEHSDILANYRLHMWWNDTQVNKMLHLKEKKKCINRINLFCVAAF